MPGTARWWRWGIGSFLAFLAVGTLSVCGSGSSTTTQVAVKVNKDEITALQINNPLTRLTLGILADRVEFARGQIIGRLENEQLEVQQALEHKLDRDPSVLGALEAARVNVLSHA